MPTLKEQVETLVANLVLNEARADAWVNGTDAESYTPSGGGSVPSIRKFIADTFNYQGAYAAGGTDYTIGQTFKGASAPDSYKMFRVTANFTSTTLAGDAANYEVIFDFAQVVADAETAQGAAETAQGAAETAQGAAEAAQGAAEAALDQFTDQYLGAFATDPTLDNDGDPLTAGDLYYDITNDNLKIYNGSIWVGTSVSGISVAGTTATATWTSLIANSTAAQFLSLAINGVPVLPLVTPSEDGSIYKIRGIASRATENLRAGVYADGTDEAFTSPDQPELSFGVGEDCSFMLPTFILPDWTPGTEVVLRNPTTANSGVKLAVTTGGNLKLSIGDGTSFTDYTSTETIGSNLPAWAALQITPVLDRDGNASIYIDGGLFETFDISAQETDSILDGGATYLDGAEGYALGYAGTFNKALTANEAATAFHLPDWAKRNGFVDIVRYVSGDGTTGWSAINTTLTEESIGGRTALKMVADAAETTQKRIRHSDAGIVAGQTYFIVFDYYVPSGQAEIIGVTAQTTAGSTSVPEVTLQSTNDAWTTYAAEFVAGNSGQIDFVPNDTDNTVTTTTTAGQYVGLDNIKVYSPGACCLLDLSVAGATKTDLMGLTALISDGTRGANAEDTI